LFQINLNKFYNVVFSELLQISYNDIIKLN
jgi:hypothetical protein